MLIILILLSACADFRLGWVDENSFSADNTQITQDDFDGPLKGHFDEDGQWVPDDPKIEWTYKIPDIGAGFIFDGATNEITPSIQFELVEYELPLPYLGTWKLDAGVGYQRTYLYTGPLLTSIFEISTGAWIGWNWKDGDLAFGAGFTIIRF